MNCFVLSGTYADLHMAQLLPLPLTVSCFSKIQISFNFLVLAYPGTPGKGPLNGVCVGGDIKTQLSQSIKSLRSLRLCECVCFRHAVCVSEVRLCVRVFVRCGVC